MSLQLSEEEYLRDLSIFNVPFSRDIDDYDEDGDGFVDKDEFVEFVLSTIKPMQLKDPEDMMIPFEAADLNGKFSMLVQLGHARIKRYGQGVQNPHPLLKNHKIGVS